MDAVIGALLLAAAVILSGWVMVEFRRPVPGHWTTWELTSQLVVTLLVALIAVGFVFLVRFAMRADEHLTLADLAMIAGAAAVAVLLVLAQRRRWRRLLAVAAQAPAPASAIVGTTAPTGGANNDTPPVQPGQGRPPRGRTPKAA